MEKYSKGQQFIAFKQYVTVYMWRRNMNNMFQVSRLIYFIKIFGKFFESLRLRAFIQV